MEGGGGSSRRVVVCRCVCRFHSIGPSDQRRTASQSTGTRSRGETAESGRPDGAPVGCADPRSPRGRPTRARLRAKQMGRSGRTYGSVERRASLDAASRGETAESVRPDRGPKTKKALQPSLVTGPLSGRPDSNRRPPEPHSGALPGCATSRGTAKLPKPPGVGYRPPPQIPLPTRNGERPSNLVALPYILCHT